MATSKKKAARSGEDRRGTGGLREYRGHSTARRRGRRVESADTQRARLLAYLMARGSVSTLEARGRELKIMHPAGRVRELRQAGYRISTVRDVRQGCGRYVLRGVPRGKG